MILCICPNPSVDKYVWLKTFVEREPNRATKEKNFPGGKGIHVAFGLKELGHEVKVLGFWGGPTGAWIQEQCRKSGIVCAGPETASWTRTCITFKSDGQLNDTELLGTGPEIDLKLFSSFVKTYRDLISDAACVTMSGSWPKGAPDNGYAQLMEIANQHRKKVFLDCAGHQLINAFSQKPFTIHLNEKEAKELKLAATMEESVLTLTNDCQFAAVTAGARGLFYSDGKQIIHAKIELKNIYSTVGSGDSLLAGLTSAYCKNLNLEETARLGAACGAANCLREDLGGFYKTDVDKLLGKVDLRKINP